MAAIGDVFANVESVTNDNYMTIRPAEGAEANITYITVNNGGKCIVSHYDGTNESVFMNLSAAGGDAMPFAGQGFPVSYTDYLRVQNKSGSAAVIMSYAGYYTKVAS